MKTQQHIITSFLFLLFSVAAVNAQEKKQKASVEPNKSTTAAPSKKKEQADSNRIKKEVQAEKKHKQADSARIWKEEQVEIKHKQANSVRIEKDVQIEKKHLQKDSLKSIQHEKKTAPARKKEPMDNVKSKKVVMSISCQPDATVILHNIMRHVEVLATNDSKVTLVAIVQYEGQSGLTDKEWFSKLNISLAENGNYVEVNTGEVVNNLNGESLANMVYNGVTVFDSLGNATNRRSKADREIILYVPKCANVNVESKHADITFGNNMRNIEVKMANGRLSLMDAEQLQTTMSYARIDAGKIKQANIEIKNGQLRVQSIGTLTLTSSNSSVLLEKVDSLRIKDSQADNFDIRLADYIEGRKYFGDMQLAKLTGSIKMEGQNASMKVKSISSSTTLVKINNQYASVQLSVNALKNYTVAFEGKGGSVSAPFKKAAAAKGAFSSSIGNVKNSPTVFQLSCNDCKLNFN